MISVLVCLVLITFAGEVSPGFIYGAPCSERNTAVLDTTGRWRYPKEPVTCVDITSLGNRTNLTQSFRIVHATTLYADHMHLASVPHNVLTLMPLVELVDFSSNVLRRFPKDAFQPLRNLYTLLLESNRIIIPKRAPLLKSGSLKTLSLSNNNIRRLRPQTFREVPTLSVLYLDRNRLKKLRRGVFDPLKHLKYLHLGNNRLTVINVRLPVPKGVVIVKGNPLNSTGPIRR